MNRPTQEELNQFAVAYETRFADAIELGFTAYSTVPAAHKLQFRKRTQSSAVNDFIINAAKVAFSDVPEANWVSKHGVEILQIPFGKRIVRAKFKMLSPNRRPSNIATQSVLNFLNQLMLDGFEPNVNLIAGYIYNPTRTAPSAKYLICPDGPVNRWEYPLETGQAIGAEQFQESPDRGGSPSRISQS